MSTTTTRLALTKPDIGQTSWGTDLNTTIDRLDSQATFYLNAHGDKPLTSPTAVNDEFDGTGPSWTWVNQGSATATIANGYLALTAPSSASQNARIYVQTAPATPYTVTSHFNVGGALSSTYWGGIVLRNSTSGRFLGIGQRFTTFFSYVMIRYASATSINASTFATGNVGIQTFKYFKVDVTSTTATISASIDGLAFSPLTSETLATYINAGGGTVDQCGLFVDNTNSTATTLAAHFFHV